MSTITKERLAEILARARAGKAIPAPTQTPTQSVSAVTGMHGESITYNKEQQEIIRLGSSGASCVLIGAAGTGKTTSTQGIARALIQSGKIPAMQGTAHKYLSDGTPGILFCAYTRRAVNNIRKAAPMDLKANCITFHKLLEYEPVYYDVYDVETDSTKKTMRFEATRNEFRPLPPCIKTIFVEEGSMVSVELFDEVRKACPHGVQFIFLGDIQQLPPVFGSAILGFKMIELPTVELVQVYRQALESPIIRLAHRILSGNGIPAAEFPEWNIPGKLKLHPWKKKISADSALSTAALFFKKAFDAGEYVPEEDIILIPFNKAFGTDELNKHIANHLARHREAVTYEIVAGFRKHYFSVGDKILFDKEDAIIKSIVPNPKYLGKPAQPPSQRLDYWGCVQDGEGEHHIEEDTSEADVDFLLDQMAIGEADEDRVRSASHILQVYLLDSERVVDIDSASAVNGIILGYALTVHKSQGSEFRKVFFVLHESHATMIQRELLYTAVTRAREELYVICEPESFVKGIKSQRIKGNTLAEKAEFFKGKMENNR